GVRKGIRIRVYGQRKRGPPGAPSVPAAADQVLVVLVCLSISARAVSRSLRPSKPRLFMSSTHSTSIERERRRNSCASAGGTVKIVLPRSVADLRPGTSPACCTLPSQPDVAMPELLSMTFLRSGGSEAYLFLFMHITNVVV